MSAENGQHPLALKEWAVTCDALARGEQILLLRAGRPESVGSGDLAGRVFWLYPTLSGQSASAVADPYRDRMRALDALDRSDGRARLQYAAAAEHVERIADPDRLMALDGHHTLNRSAVERRLRTGGPEEGLLFMVLRVHRRESAVVIEQTDVLRAADGWVRVEGPPAAAIGRRALEEGMEPVLDDDRFLTRKAELLQLTGSVRAL